MVAGSDICNRLASEAGVVAGGAGFGGGKDIDEVVGDLGSLGGRGLGGADFAIAVDSDGVATDDFAMEVPCEIEGEGGFTAGGGAEEQYQQGMIGGETHPMRHQPGAKRACLSARRKARSRSRRASRIRPRIC
jgi:hypothetical protein